jgi:tetratricopeptide (TPR) repeat protein
MGGDGTGDAPGDGGRDETVEISREATGRAQPTEPGTPGPEGPPSGERIGYQRTEPPSGEPPRSGTPDGVELPPAEPGRAEPGAAGSAPAQPEPVEPGSTEPGPAESEPTVSLAAGSQGADSASEEPPSASEPTVRVPAAAAATGDSPLRSEGVESEPAGSLSVEAKGADPQPVGPPVPEGAGRSAVAAVLLNLTGLGLGYVYLRRRLRATAVIVIVAIMVVVAFTNDAASTPWLWRILAASWVLATAVDAWVVVRHLPRPDTRVQRLRPVAVGFLAVLAVVVGHIGYAEAGRATYAAGLAAQGRADCTQANRSFDAVTGPYELTLSRDVPAAAVRRAECTKFLAAEQFERSGAHAEAVAGYQTFRSDHAGSLLEPFAQEGTRRALLAWAVELRGAGDLDGAIARYRELLRELEGDPGAAQVREDLAATHVERASAARDTMVAAAGHARVEAMRDAMDDLLLVGRELADTPTAAGVPQAVLDTFTEANSAFAEGRFCDALPVLDYAVTLPDAAGLAPVANGDRARSLSECGLANFNAGDYTGATDRFESLVADYPNDPGVPQARSAIITAEVGRAAGTPLPLPAPIDSPGSEPVLVYNAAATEVRVLVAGPTAHELTLPPCPGCPASYATGAESCPGAAGKPSTPLRLRPGTYHVMQDRAELGPDESVNEPITVRPGGGELCVTVTER